MHAHPRLFSTLVRAELYSKSDRTTECLFTVWHDIPIYRQPELLPQCTNTATAPRTPGPVQQTMSDIDLDIAYDC
jgi:hypothetical protein